MLLPVLVAVATLASFFAIAHMAVRTPPTPFRRASALMLWTAGLVALVSLPAGAGVIGAVLLGRRLAPAPVPATVPGWLSQSR